jgi:hypothetical protein
MIPSPYNFEPALTDLEYAKLGVLALRWSHIEHILGNCLKVLLRSTDEEAIIMVFPLSADQRAEKIKQLSELQPLPEHAQRAFEELRPVLKDIQYVRNNVVHSIVGEDETDGHVFHLRSKNRSLTKAQVFGTEELTNYAGHLVIALRYGLGFKDGNPPMEYTCPARPEIPDFLKTIIHFKK